MDWWIVTGFGQCLDLLGAAIFAFDLREEFNQSRATRALQVAKYLLLDHINRVLISTATDEEKAQYARQYSIEEASDDRTVELLSRSALTEEEYETLNRAVWRIWHEYQWPVSFPLPPRPKAASDLAWLVARYKSMYATLQFVPTYMPYRFRISLRWAAVFLVVGFLLQIVGTIGAGVAG